MSFCVLSLRLMVITLLILCSLAGIKTNAIPQPNSEHGRNESGSAIFLKPSDITTSTTADLEKDFEETNIEYEQKSDRDFNEHENLEPELVTNSIENFAPENVETPDSSTTEVPITQRTTPTNIYSVTTKRNKTKNTIKIESRNTKSAIENTSTASTETTSEREGRKRTSVGDSELAKIDIEDDDDDETFLNRRNTKKNNISAEKLGPREDKKNEVKNFTQTKGNNDATHENSNKSQAEKPQSHIYKVNSNYKRYKKLNILPPKRYWRDPNDNSWRNESISSLGIKFKPKANATKAFQFRKKDLSELETILSETENSTGPGLRERLERLSEIRKSKKKFNTSAEMSGEEFVDYEEENIKLPLTEAALIITTEVYSDQNFIRTSTTSASSETMSKPYNELNKQKNIMKVVKDLKPVTEPTKNYVTNMVRKVPEMKTKNFDLVGVEQQIELKFKTQALKKESSKHKTTNTVRQEPETFISNMNHREVRYENKKDEVSPNSEKQKQFDDSLEPENNDEFHDYALELSKEVLNSSESWSEKEVNAKTSSIPFTNEDNKVKESTNILDSLEDYLNSNRHSTTPITLLYPSINDNIHEKYMQSQLPEAGDKSFTTLNPNILPKFINPVNLPIGPRNKAKISLSQSYSYNTMPHKEISVQYNNTVIHNYNIPLPTNLTYGNHHISSSVNDQSAYEFFSDYDRDKVSNGAVINQKSITRISEIPQSRGPEFIDIVNFESMAENIRPVPRTVESMNSNNGPNENIEPLNHNIEPLDHMNQNIEPNQNSEPLKQNSEPSPHTALLNKKLNHVNQNIRPLNQNIELVSLNKPINGNIDSTYQNFGHTSQNIAPLSQSTEPISENIRTLPQDIRQISHYIEPIPQYLEKIIVPIPQQNNEPQKTRLLHNVRPLLSQEQLNNHMKGMPTISPSISLIIPPKQSIVNNIIHHSYVANHGLPVKKFTSGILQNAMMDGPGSRQNIHKEIKPLPTSVSEEYSSRSGPMDRNAFQEPVLPNFINQSPIVPSNIGQQEPQYEIPIVQNAFLKNVPRQDFIFQNINSAPIIVNGKHQTQIPILFNSTVLHTSHAHDSAVSNTYVRSLYENMFVKDARDVMKVAYSEAHRELPPSFLVRYNFPHQKNNN